jgi:hypothetical protein
MVSLLTVTPYHLGEVGGDLSGGQPARTRQHHLIDAGRAPLPLAHDHRLQRDVPVARHLNSGPGRSRSAPSWLGCRCRLGAVAAHRVVLVVTEMLAHLRLQGGLEHGLRQPGDQATGNSTSSARGASTRSCAGRR